MWLKPLGGRIRPAISPRARQPRSAWDKCVKRRRLLLSLDLDRGRSKLQRKQPMQAKATNDRGDTLTIPGPHSGESRFAHHRLLITYNLQVLLRSLFAAVLVCLELQGAELDLSAAHISAPAALSKTESKAIEMLRDEVEKRTLIRLESVTSSAGPAIAITRGNGPAEGYALKADATQVSLTANDARGMLFGIGRLLRELHMRRGRISIDANLNIRTSPKYPLRGHQLGYRPKTNSYDGWSVPVWEQYIRDLAVFGTNAVELIPPRSDDAPDSPHFPLPPMQMMIEMSRLLDEYGF